MNRILIQPTSVRETAILTVYSWIFTRYQSGVAVAFNLDQNVTRSFLFIFYRKWFLKDYRKYSNKRPNKRPGSLLKFWGFMGCVIGEGRLLETGRLLKYKIFHSW